MKAADEIDKLTKQLNDGSLPADEPLFTLRARDLLAPSLVELWADTAEKHGVNAEKVEEARRHFDAMVAWPESRLPD